MDGGAGVGGDRITHPAGPLQLYGLKFYGRLCMQTGVVRKIRSAESPMGEKRSIKHQAVMAKIREGRANSNR